MQAASGRKSAPAYVRRWSYRKNRHPQKGLSQSSSARPKNFALRDRWRLLSHCWSAPPGLSQKTRAPGHSWATPCSLSTASRKRPGHISVVELHPEDAASWRNLGYAFHMQQRPREALVAYDRAIAVDPEHLEVWNRRATALQMLGRFAEMLQASEQARALDATMSARVEQRGHRARRTQAVF